MIEDKRGQSVMSMPFGIIFSIILIVVFIVIAFIAVNHFIDIKNCATVGKFYENLQIKVDEAWASQTSNFEFKIDLPSGADKVCFANLSAPINNNEDYKEIEVYSTYDANTFIIPAGKACNMPYKSTRHLDIEKITKDKNPYCVSPGTITIKKDFYDKSVIIK